MASALHNAIREKQTILRRIYGGMMSSEDLHRELGMDPEAARLLMIRNGIGNRIGKRIKFETDEVAKFIVLGRGMV